MAGKRKFKRDYIILEAKDTNFRYKERVLPKAFAKVEINDEKAIVSLYVENLKFVKDGYRVVAIQSDYETMELGNIMLNEQGKGEFTLNLLRDDVDIKGIALIYDKHIPLIGFKGSKIDNYEEILFADQDDEYEEIEYEEVEDNEELDFDEYEEIEYIEVDDEDGYIEDDYVEDEYEDNDQDDNKYYEIVEEYEEEEEYEVREEYDEYDNVEEAMERNIKASINKETEIKIPNKERKDISRNSKPLKQKQQRKNTQPRQKQENSKTASSLLMPRQIKKGLKHFNEVKPFVTDEIDNTRWWKIEITPTTLCGYTMPHLGYVNTLNYTMYSDAVMNSYKYRHYLFGVQYDEYNKRKNYIYAVPGSKSEQPDKGHTGFRLYQPCDTRNDSLGYWLCLIDSRTRRIIK